MFPLAPRHFDLENGVSNGTLYFYEDFNESTENRKQKVIDVLFKYKPILLIYDAYSADKTNANFSKFHLDYKLFTKK